MAYLYLSLYTVASLIFFFFAYKILAKIIYRKVSKYGDEDINRVKAYLEFDFIKYLLILIPVFALMLFAKRFVLDLLTRQETIGFGMFLLTIYVFAAPWIVFYQDNRASGKSRRDSIWEY